MRAIEKDYLDKEAEYGAQMQDTQLEKKGLPSMDQRS